MKNTINAFPDSGWYTVFYALEGAIEESDWRSPVGKPWLKGRFGAKVTLDEDGEQVVKDGFWVAIDLTIGKSTRGYTVADALVTEKAPSKAKPAVINDVDDEDSMPSTALNFNPYISGSIRDLPETLSLKIHKEFDLGTQYGDLILNVNFLEEAGDPVKVNLVVDFGNSRTVVLALEQSGIENGLSSACRPIVFPDPVPVKTSKAWARRVWMEGNPAGG